MPNWSPGSFSKSALVVALALALTITVAATSHTSPATLVPTSLAGASAFSASRTTPHDNALTSIENLLRLLASVPATSITTSPTLGFNDVHARVHSGTGNGVGVSSPSSLSSSAPSASDAPKKPPRLHPIPDTFRPGDDITVSWNNVPQPDWIDWVGLYCGAQAQTLDYADLQLVGLIPTGAGKAARFPSLEERRCDYRVDYVKTSLFSPDDNSTAETATVSGMSSDASAHLTLYDDDNYYSDVEVAALKANAAATRAAAAANRASLSNEDFALLAAYMPSVVNSIISAAPTSNSEVKLPQPILEHALSAGPPKRSNRKPRVSLAAAANAAATAPGAVTITADGVVVGEGERLEDNERWARAVWRRIVSQSRVLRNIKLNSNNNNESNNNNGIYQEAVTEVLQLKSLLLENFSKIKHMFRFTVIATVTVPSSVPLSRPHQVRLAHSNETGALWVSYTAQDSVAVRPTWVEFGTAPNSLSRRIAAASETHTAREMCAAPANVTGQVLFSNPGHHHSALMTGLKADTRYFYRVGSESTGWSPVHSFIAPAASTKQGVNTNANPNGDVGAAANADDSDKPVRLAFASDWGSYKAPRSHSTVSRILADAVAGDAATGAAAPPLRAVFAVGDVSYALGSTLLWDRFLRMVEPLSSRVPLQVTVGNHEYTYRTSATGTDITGEQYPGWHPKWGNMRHDSGGECGVALARRFKSPSGPGARPAAADVSSGNASSDDDKDQGNGVFWYALDQGAAKLIALSSDHEWTHGSRQHAWLNRTLAAVDRTTQPFVIVLIHRPLYTTQLCEDDEQMVAIRMRAELEPLLQFHRVSLVISGHQHSYERSCPVHGERCVEQPKNCDKRTGECRKQAVGAHGYAEGIAAAAASASAGSAEADILCESGAATFGAGSAAVSHCAGRRDPNGNSNSHGDDGDDDASVSGDDTESKRSLYSHVWRGTVHLVAGNAGAPLQPCGFSDKFGKYSVERENVHGYLRATVSKKRLEVEHVRTDDGGVHDRVTIFPWQD